MKEDSCFEQSTCRSFLCQAKRTSLHARFHSVSLNYAQHNAHMCVCVYSKRETEREREKKKNRKDTEKSSFVSPSLFHLALIVNVEDRRQSRNNDYRKRKVKKKKMQ